MDMQVLSLNYFIINTGIVVPKLLFFVVLKLFPEKSFTTICVTLEKRLLPLTQRLKIFTSEVI